MKKLALALITLLLVLLPTSAATVYYYDQMDVFGYVDDFVDVSLTPVDYLPFDFENPVLTNSYAKGLHVLDWSIVANISNNINVTISHDKLVKDDGSDSIDYVLNVEKFPRSVTPMYVSLKSGVEESYFLNGSGNQAGAQTYSYINIPMLLYIENKDDIEKLSPGRYYSEVKIEVVYE